MINIAKDKKYYKADLFQKHLLKRKRVVKKPDLDSENKKQRLEYYDIVHEYYQRDSLLI